MAMTPATVSRGPGGSGLVDVLNVLLDKGLVIDVFLRVSLVGIEVLTVDARIVLASVDTYLRFAEAVNRLDLTAVGNNRTIFDLQQSGAKEKTKGALEGGKEGLAERFGLGRKEEDKEESSSKSS